MKRKIVNKQSNGRHCFVCGVDNDKGLSAYFYETEDDQVVGLFTPTDEHQSYPGRLHGGIAASMLDETIGRAVQIGAPNVWGVTVELSLSYKKPLPLGVELKVLGRITHENRLLFDGEGEIYTPDGEVAVSAKAKYVKMTLDRITDESLGEDVLNVYLDMDDPTEVEI